VWRRSERAPGTAGFTLIEIIVVIAVIAVLASVVSPMVFRNVSDAKMSAARSQVEIFALALDSYRVDNDEYPTTDLGLDALRTAPDSVDVPNWRGPYIRREVPFDPWGRPWVYVSPGDVNPRSYDLISYGRDGEPGGDEEDADVSSWN